MMSLAVDVVIVRKGIRKLSPLVGKSRCVLGHKYIWLDGVQGQGVGIDIGSEGGRGGGGCT